MKILGKKGTEKRYQFNKAALGGFDGYIYGQTRQPVAGLKYGGGNKKISAVGCGAAAVYNVMKFIGRYQSFAEVARDCELLSLPFFGGRFGTKTQKLGRYFNLHGVKYSEFRSCGDFVNALKACNIAIVCSWNNKITDGIHFYCVYPENGGYKSLNYRSSDCPCDYSPDVLKPERFIIGYCF
ncbi:MAG TPA: hypothetical protein DEO32_04180 [Ruminococcaceae bacterium]|nr:hypothetical protein [Oscillospiraceae bacterium]